MMFFTGGHHATGLLILVGTIIIHMLELLMDSGLVEVYESESSDLLQMFLWYIAAPT